MKDPEEFLSTLDSPLPWEIEKAKADRRSRVKEMSTEEVGSWAAMIGSGPG